MLEEQGYQLTGKHSAVKVCYWTTKALTEGRHCYKGRFYGIESHRCMQMSPSIDACNLHCRFCWRYQGWEEEDTMKEFDDPATLLQKSLEAQKLLLSGFGGNPNVDRATWEEANRPRHVAISLTGEPTLYPMLSEYLRLCHEKGITTFLVTNGTHPDALRHLDPLPTQLYCSVTAPNREVFQRLTLPAQEDAWDRLLESLEVLRGLRTRRVIRHTLVKGWNLGWEEQYAELDGMAQPDFIEPKGYVYMGRSRQRLTRDHVPEHPDIQRFASRLSELTGYPVVDESPESKVLLLAKDPERRWLPGRAPSERKVPEPEGPRLHVIAS
ncbi:MAG: 4-demethylwyosine synthase TYW1 [Euryarchaeota archaeon]|nr:4-demethylwyosine synthase TYW1 [Euryarchaeota archaeon]MDE1881190.1 4-demethylwyosine synthase TYW1 [Euryarchaeota archaeon]